MTSTSPLPGYRKIFQLAWPIILANCSVPLLGLVDTAVIGHTGSAVELGAIALGALIFSFAYWGFGFLRMGTTGFVARADGQQNEAEVRAALGRALLLATAIGLGLLVLQWPTIWAALQLLGASQDVETTARQYFLIRIWGAPAALGGFALMGLFIGLGRTGYILAVQVFLNGLNIILDLTFAGLLGWGANGIALGTALAEWAALGFGGWLAYRLLRARYKDDDAFLPWALLRSRQGFLDTLGANTDIMLRTLFMLFAFAWFINQGAQFGDRILAANHILLQLIAFSAFFLDGYAHAVEPLVGRAAGARNLALFDVTVRRSTHLAAVTAFGLCLAIAMFGDYAIAALTSLPALREVTTIYLPYTAIYVLLSFAAFQLDGIFIGTSQVRDMRNTSIVSVIVFLAAAWWLTQWAGNHGLWLAFIFYVVVRALTLSLRYPALRRTLLAPELRD